MRRIIPGILLGTFVAFAVQWLVESVSGALLPLPEGFDPYSAANQGVMLQYDVPLLGKLMLILGWCLGALFGGAVAAYFSRRRIGAWVVAGLVIASALAATRSVYHGILLPSAALILPCLCALAVQNLALLKRRLS
ncbi:hypothetical protein FHS31_000957 [Sphingomonas vulcanisoli]|uniref:DUF4345 domain-containing protein n=1 Tax=Sphingomonas vulcanisoli TaxID=1658060 RepID=A0ABX0TUT6_9SPHN|nr:hypothetical protein [Sphingomonas vulcanisoli]